MPVDGFLPPVPVYISVTGYARNSCEHRPDTQCQEHKPDFMITKGVSAAKYQGQGCEERIENREVKSNV